MSDVNVSAQPTAPVGEAPQDPGLAEQQEPTLTGAGQDAASAVKDAAKEAMRKYKLKVDGQEIEVDEEELKRGYSHQRAANKILQEGKAARKQAEEFIAMMKDQKKLFEVIQKLGHDPRRLAEEYLSAQLEEELMDPRERELKQAKLKLQQYEEMERKQKEALERQRDEALKKKFAEDYSKQFVEALKEISLPPTKAMVAEMAKYIHRAAKMQFQMTAKEAAQLVKEDIEAAHRNLYGESDAETLVRLLGDQGLQKLRAYDTSRLKDPTANLKTPTEQPEPTQRTRSQNRRMSDREWREYNRK